MKGKSKKKKEEQGGTGGGRGDQEGWLEEGGLLKPGEMVKWYESGC